ncbi:MAG: OmpA family protein, partial [Bacteroidota bacterium]
ETGKIIGKSKSDPVDGSYFIVLPLGKIYGYYINHSEFYPFSGNLDILKKGKSIEIVKTIELVTFKEMIEKSIAVPMNNLFFDFGKYNLLPYSIPELNRVAQIIKKENLKVEIAGHTDNTGDEIANQTLSEKRATSVKHFLLQAGCKENLLQTIGFGESKPIDTNENEMGRAKNRRVEIRFIK